MNQNYLAVIDCGTNTFHLLIVEKDANSSFGFKEKYRNRQYVFLADKGISTISKEAIIRSKSTIDTFAEAIGEFNNLDLQIVGTEALRIASNGSEIINYITTKLGKAPSIITGDREAELIYKGNLLAMPKVKDRYLIMDIGGGSTEFIVADQQGIVFSASYPLGVSKMYNIFNDGEPISGQAIVNFQKHLDSILVDLSSVIFEYPINILLGASGSFEVLASAIEDCKVSNDLVGISLIDFRSFYDRILKMNVDQRLKVNGIPESRVKLISIALVMIDHIITTFTPSQLFVSPYAIKEGLINEWLSNSSSI